MHKMILLSIAALASLVGAAIAQTPEPEPAWRDSALALVPAGYVGGDAYRTDEAAMTGYLAVYPANANDPKSPAAYSRRGRRSSSSSPKAMARIVGRIEPRATTRGNRDTTMTDPDGDERVHEAARRTRGQTRDAP